MEVLQQQLAYYTYLWDNTVSLPSGSNLPLVNNLLAGTYTVTITDANGCDTTLAILVTQPSQIQNDFTISMFYVLVIIMVQSHQLHWRNLTGGTPSYLTLGEQLIRYQFQQELIV